MHVLSTSFHDRPARDRYPAKIGRRCFGAFSSTLQPIQLPEIAVVRHRLSGLWIHKNTFLLFLPQKTISPGRGPLFHSGDNSRCNFWSGIVRKTLETRPL
jgi:hypothetical protein